MYYISYFIYTYCSTILYVFCFICIVYFPRVVALNTLFAYVCASFCRMSCLNLFFLLLRWPYSSPWWHCLSHLSLASSSFAILAYICQECLKDSVLVHHTLIIRLVCLYHALLQHNRYFSV
jgi:hypothetical protein